MGNNLISRGSINNEETLIEVLRRMGNESYNKEEQLYNKIRNFSSTFPSFNNAQTLTSVLKNSSNFEDFQKAMKKIVYGNQEYIKYFYDSRVIQQISAETTEKSTNIITDALQDILGSSYLKNKKVQFSSIKELNNQMQGLAKDITKQIIDKQNMLFKEPIKEYEDKLYQAILKQLELGTYNFGYSRSGGKFQKVWEINEKEFTTDITPNNPPDKTNLKMAKNMSPQEKGDGIVMKNVAAIATIDELKNQVRGGKTTTIQLFGDKNILLPIIQKALDNFSDKNDLHIKKDTGSGQDEELRKTNLFEVKSSDYNINISLSFYKNYNTETATSEDKNKLIIETDKIIDIFFSVLEDVIVQVMEKDGMDNLTINNFKNWCNPNSKIGKSMKNLIINNPNTVYEIFSKRTKAHVAGMLGETLFGVFLECFDEENNSGVEIYGQTDLGTGQAAVDVGLITKSLQRVGFQIKNYSSISNTISLYNQSNKLSAWDEMKRYIEEGYYKILEEIFLQNNKENSLLWTNNESKTNELLNKAEDILNRHIPYYIRYDEAQIQNSQIQNNFYIINFSFIPASVIFYTMAESIESELDKNDKTNFFFLSSEKQESTNLLSAKNFNESWFITYQEIADKNTPDNTENLLSKINNSLYINFVGMRITFQKKLDILFSNATKLK